MVYVNFTFNPTIRKRCCRVNNLHYFILSLIVQFITILCFHERSVAQESAENLHRSETPHSSANRCRGILLEWVKDDLKDTVFNLPHTDESNLCLKRIQQERSKQTSSKPSPNSHEKWSEEHFQALYHQRIDSSHAESSLKNCIESAPDRYTKNALYRKYYFTALNIEAENSLILDELVFYESVLESPYSPLQGIDCKSEFTEVMTKCHQFKKSIKTCNEGRSTRFQSIVDKTKNYLDKIENLKTAHRQCLKKYSPKHSYQSKLSVENSNTTCDSIFRAILYLEGQVPWVKGEVFKSLAITQNPSYTNNFRTIYEPKIDKLKIAIANQLTENKRSLIGQYKVNNESFDCLLTQEKINQTDCDFKKIRQHIVGQNLLPLNSINSHDSTNSKYKQIQNDFLNESCLQSLRQKTTQLNKTAQNIGISATLALLPWTTAALLSGITLRGAATALSFNRALIISNTGAGALMVQNNISEDIESCFEQTRETIRLHPQSNNIVESLCQKNLTSLNQIMNSESDCILNSLLKAENLLPFFGSSAGLGILNKSNSRLNITPLAAKSQNIKGVEFSSTKPSEFASQIAKISEDSKKYVRVRSEKDYTEIVSGGGTLYLNADKTVGYAIKGDGELISVFKLTDEKGKLDSLLKSAIDNGAKYLHVVKGSLAETLYKKNGWLPQGQPFIRTNDEFTSIERAWGDLGSQVQHQKMIPPQH